VYDKKLKRGKDGLFTRYVGQNARGTPEKFRLGYEQAAAEEKVRLIAALWSEIESELPRPFWDSARLEAAKAIAKGKPPTLPRKDHEDPIKYVRRVTAIGQAAGTPFQPGDPLNHQVGLDDLRDELVDLRKKLSDSTGVPAATGITVRQAMTAYEAHVRRSLTAPDGFLRPWGRTKLDQLDSIRSYLADERFGGRDFLSLDLAGLSYDRCEEMYGVFRRRPLTIRSKLKDRMKPSTAKNFIKELGNFFDWLDGAEAYEWTFPRRFHAIKKTPDDLTAPEQYARRMGREKLVLPDEHLKLLFEYSLPSERILLLLGLNCAFAASEVGHLRKGFLKLDQSIIDGIRFKSSNDTRHWLWPQTKDGLEWILAERRAVRAGRAEHADVVFVTDRGNPLWHATKRGSVSDGVSNVWYRLIRRVQKDHPEFPSYSFNKLRKTSATRILEIADAETASMILAHKTIGEDELLHHYALLPWEKLFAAQRKLGEQLATIMEAGGPDPWARRVRSYLGLAKVTKLKELRQQGVPPREIAKALKVSVATVHRLAPSATTKQSEKGQPSSIDS
jgi:hypothetical protein